MTEKDIVNILEIRSALEGLATSLACRKMTKECLQQLKNMEVDFERAVAENDVERFVDIDEDFHDVIFQATENDKLIQMFRNLKIQLYRYRMAQAKSDNSMSTIVAHHRSILRALENHDSEEGAAVAQGHIKYQTESILQTSFCGRAYLTVSLQKNGNFAFCLQSSCGYHKIKASVVRI